MLKQILTLFLLFAFTTFAASTTYCKCGRKSTGEYTWNVSGTDCCQDPIELNSDPKYTTYTANTGGTWSENTTTVVSEGTARACCPSA